MADRAALWAQITGQDFQQRGLARTVLPDDAGQHTRPQDEVQASQNLTPAVRVTHVPDLHRTPRLVDRAAHALLTTRRLGKARHRTGSKAQLKPPVSPHE
ncbi:hypothetical protein GCM10010415_67240 [Streptomyces atrovirens]